MIKRFTHLAAVLLLAAGTAQAEPVIVEMLPGGLQRGKESTVTFTGSRLQDAVDVLFYEPGVKFVKLSEVAANKMVCTIAVDADAQLGKRLLRVRTKTGVSRVKPFFVGQFEEIAEAEPNNTVQEANAGEINRTFTGKITDEDVDCFKLALKKDQQLSLEIEGWRFGQYIYDRGSFFDPHISILDVNRFELASSDDTSLLSQDGFLTWTAPADGEYILQIRDSAYDGGRTAQYRLHAGTFPRPAVTYPAGGQAGTEFAFTYVLPDGRTMPGKTKLPALDGENHEIWAEQGGFHAPSPNRIRVTPFPSVNEVEPNPRDKATDGGEQFPLAFNGRIETDGDEDWFKFRMKKDRTITVQTFARSLGSTLDSVVYVRDASGKSLASNDDGSAGNLDSRFNFKAPADGEYFVHVRDHLRKGKPTHVYRVELVNPKPGLTLTVPDFSNNNSHYRKHLCVPQGGRFATVFNLGRRSVSGNEPLVLNFENLPAGVKVVNNQVPAGVPNWPIVFEAAPDAALAGTMAQPKVMTAKEDKRVSGGLALTSNLIKGPPGNTTFYRVVSEQMPSAVVQKPPFRLTLHQQKAPLVQYGRLAFKVTAERDEGFKAPIKVWTLWRPPNVSGPNEVTIAEGKNEVYFTLYANGNASRDWKLVVLGEAGTGTGNVYNASNLIDMKVVPYFIGGKIKLTAVEQGKNVELRFPVSQKTPFEGQATASLLGMPKGVTAEPIQVTKDTKEFVFQVKVPADAGRGTHKSLYVQLKVPYPAGGEGVTASQRMASGGILRIDAPKPPEPKEPTAGEPKKVAGK